MKQYYIFILMMALLMSFISAASINDGEFLAYFPLNNTLNQTDLLGNQQFNLTHKGDPTLTTTATDCKRDGCLEFDGNDAIYSSFGAIDVGDNEDGFGMCVWVNYTNCGTRAYHMYVQENDAPGEVFFRSNSGGEYALNYGDTGGGTFSSITCNVWHHLCWSVNSSSFNTWVDNVTYLNVAVGTYGTTASIFIGERSDAADGSVVGRMDEAVFINRTGGLTPVIVSDLYGLYVPGGSAPPPPTTPPNIDDTTWNMSSEIPGCTNWRTSKSNQCNTTDTTPTVRFDTDVVSYCALYTSDLNYTSMLTIDSSLNCTTTGSTNHVCTLPVAYKLGFQQNYLYVGCQAPTGEENITSTSTSLNLYVNISDTLPPNITLNTINGFTAANITTSPDSDYLPLDINITDNLLLNQFYINISYDINSSLYYTFSNTSLSGTEYNFINNLTVTSWPTGTYTVVVLATDTVNSTLIHYKYTKGGLTVVATSTPSIASNATDLLGFCQGVDGLGDNVSFDWIWYKDGAIYNVSELVFPNYCYQETANESTSCGGQDNGSYSIVGAAPTDRNNLYDANYSTFATDSAGLYNLYINYTVPENTASALWQIGVNSTNITNVTINQGCMGDSLNTGILRLRFESSFAGNSGKFYCLNNTSPDTLLLTGVNRLGYEEAIFWNISTGFVRTNYTSGQTINLANISNTATNNNENWIFSCRAHNPTTNSDFVNATTLPILPVLLDNCSTYTNEVLNFFYKDEVTSDLISVDASYDFTFESPVIPDISLNGTFSDVTNSSFCSNINSSQINLTWNVTGQLTLTKESYATRLFDITNPFDANNNNPTNESFYLIKLNDSSTVVFEWLTTAFQPITGTMLIYRCGGDGTRTLVGSTAIIDSQAEANLELLNTAYSYEVVIGGKVFTDLEAYTLCHIETQTERRFFVQVEGVDLAPVLGIYSIPCNFTRIGDNTVYMQWGLNPESSETITGCVNSYTTNTINNTLFSQTCNTAFALNVTIADPGIAYQSRGKLYQNGFAISCGEAIEFGYSTTTSDLFGLLGIFSIILLIISGALLYANTGESMNFGAIVGILLAFFLGLFPFGWVTISAIIFLELILVWIGRYSRKQ